MSSGDFTDLIGEVEILPAGDTDLETKWQGSEPRFKALQQAWKGFGGRMKLWWCFQAGCQMCAPYRLSRGYTPHLKVIHFKSQCLSAVTPGGNQI